jgi:phosphoglucan,water dikinase
VDDLASAAVYLQWVSTGVIECSESGGHQRPNRAANVARGIFINIERALGDAYGNAGVDEAPRLAARRVLPWLPSFSGQFTCAVPLTRIRDIAHRNDIPQDVKQEIKHTIQNKLHRNAGPEDLVATEKMLARITAKPGEYNESFVNEFRIFHAELKDFFNARTTMERLDAIESGLDESGKGSLGALRAAKSALDAASPDALAAWAAGAGGGTPGAASARERELALATQHAATSLRASLLAKLASGLRNDASDDAIATRQAWRAAEQALEQFAFVLASRVVGTLEAEGGAGAMAAARGAAAAWGPALTSAVLCVRHLGLSGFRAAECAAVEAGLAAARDAPGLGADLAAALRVKAAAQRARRLTEAHAVALVDAFGERAAVLGRGLGLPDSTSKVVAEAEVRASVAFALSNTLTLLLRAAAAAAGNADGTECVVGGDAIGTLREVERLSPGAVPAGSDATVLIVRAADGDEEVGAAGAGVAGVFLLQELPHLSHLAVRARQEHVVLATCAEEAPAAAARKLLGRRVRLRASAEGVTLTAYDGAEAGSEPASAGAAARAAAKAASAGGAQAGAVTRVSTAVLVPLEKADAASCGAKAATCGELARIAAKLSSSATSSFDTPPGVVLPFGCMEGALASAGATASYDALLKTLETAPLEGGALDAACDAMRQLLTAARPPAALLSQAAAALAARGDSRCVVRSSANVEDLAGLSGAGLYESVTGVRADDAAALGAAVGAVWASLHTRRAVLARRAARVPQAAAAMAVLMQEMVPCTHSFVLHTAAPGRPGAVLAEVAVGLGETLASGTQGAAWRLEADAPDASSGIAPVRTLGFANLSTALVPRDGGVGSVVVDYSRQPLSGAAEARAALGGQLGAVGRALEAALGCPQDVEGGLVGTRVFVVQSRPQPL